MKEQTLPKGWREVRLNEACKIITSPVDKKSIKGELPVKLCNYTDVYYNRIIDSSINYMDATAKPDEIAKFSLIIGDIIITKDSETPDDIGVPAYVKETIKNLLCGYHLTILRPVKKINGSYISYFLNSKKISYNFYRYANGITRFGLTNESYQKIKILLPSLPEQKAIASLLETWDTAIEKTEALIAAKQKQFEWLRYTLFKAMKNKNIKTFHLGSICKIQTGKKDVNQGNPRGQYPFFTCAKEYTYSDTYSYDMQAILLAGNGYIGNPIIYKGKFEAYQRTYILYDFIDVNPDFLNYFLRWVLQRKIIQEKQESAMSYIKLKTLQTIKIILPTVFEQQCIVDNFNMAQKEITLLKQLAEQYRVQKRGLIQRLLTGEWRAIRPNKITA